MRSPRSVESRERYRQAALRRTPEHYEKVAAALRGRRPTEGELVKIRAAAQRPEHKERIAERNRTRVWTPEQRAAVAARNRKRFDEGFRFIQTTAATKPERVMAAILEWAGVRFEYQARIGRSIVDFYLPDSRAVVEVDGVYWHPEGPDQSRDAKLIAAGVSSVHHVTDTALRRGGWM